MDRRISTKLWTPRRLAVITFILVLVAAISALLSYLSTPRARVEKDKLTIDTVRRGPFQEYLLPVGEVRTGPAGPEIQATVDRYDAPRLRTGQRGEVEVGGRPHPVEIAAISAVDAARKDPEVRFRFVGEPPALQPGQALPVRIPLGEPSEALLLKRGPFFQETGGRWVWVVDEARGTAAKREIRLGRQNPEVYEVLSGLAPGDRVITSTYGQLDDAEELVLAE